MAELQNFPEKEEDLKNFLKEISETLSETIKSRKVIGQARKLNELISEKLISGSWNNRIFRSILVKMKCTLSMCKIVESYIKVKYPPVWNDPERFLLLLRCINDLIIKI